MNDSMIQRIRPAAAVACTDRTIGRVERLESDASGRPAFIRVARDGAASPLMVPLDLVREVADDGSVRLRCSGAEIERLAAEAIGEAEFERTLELAEEELVPRKELREIGRVLVRKAVEEVPSRLEVDAYSEQAVIEHVPVGQVVKEQVAPWEEDGTLVVPIYEEQLVVVKRLVMKEQVRIRREAATEKRLFEDTVRRERLVVEDPDHTGLVRERYPTGEPDGLEAECSRRAEEGGLLEKLGRKVLE